MSEHQAIFALVGAYLAGFVNGWAWGRKPKASGQHPKQPMPSQPSRPQKVLAQSNVSEEGGP